MKWFSQEQSISTRALWRITVAVLAAYLAPYVILGDRGPWMIWDNLDSNFVTYKVLLESGKLFSSNSEVVEQFLGGVTRGTLPSEFDAFVWLYWLFGPEGAYVANRILMTCAAFAGMYLLLKRHILPTDQNELIHLGIALCFATLPFWPFGGLTVAGMPLVIYAALNIRSGDQRWFNWTIMIAYPFYSGLIGGGVFLLATLAFVALIDFFGTQDSRKAAARLILGLAVISAFYVLSHYRLFQDFIFSGDFISHRVEFFSEPATFDSALAEVWQVFTFGQAHAHSLHRFIVLPLVILGIYLLFQGKQSARLKKIYLLGLVFLVSTSFFYGFQNWGAVSAAIGFIKEIIPIQLQRFHWLHPVVWMVLFALALSLVSKRAPRHSWILVLAIALQLLYSARYHEYIANHVSPPASKFFAKDQFDELANFIGKPKSSYRVGSLGMHPSIAVYNGFFSIDGYHANYSLSYKYSFRSAIDGELGKDPKLKNYFDTWGSRVYLVSAELRQPGRRKQRYLKGNDTVIKDLAFDTNALVSLGAHYIISVVQIDEVKNPQFKFLKKFQHQQSAWDIYLYEIAPIGARS